jgi:hypothetical protein
MIRPGDQPELARLTDAFRSYEADHGALPGIKPGGTRDSLLEQIIESIRRRRYVSVLAERDIRGESADPRSTSFDPLRASILFHRQGNVDEAFWLLFLFVHFGEHRSAGHRYARDVYGCLGIGDAWTWERITSNHRKFESLTDAGTGAVIQSFADWVAAVSIGGVRVELVDRGDPVRNFDETFRSMRAVLRFGRLARFDYLATAGRLGFAPMRPGRLYLASSTGPLHGAKRLWGMPAGRAADLDRLAIDLDAYLQVGADVLEDALCNWDKSPARFRSFRG